jgi:hypothetical protein
MGSRWSRAVLVAATMVALTTACGGGDKGGDGVASLNGGDKTGSGQPAQASGSDEDKMREFTKCMRDHGIDMPEPDADGRITMQATGPDSGPDSDKMKKADEACKPLLPNGGKPKQMSPEDLDKARQQAKCMRDHGVDMPDPDPNSPGMSVKLGEGMDKDTVDKAFKECGLGEMKSASGPAGGGK